MACRAEVTVRAKQRDLRCVADVVEHRFAEERAADRDAVEASGKLAALPRFDGMGVAEVM